MPASKGAEKDFNSDGVVNLSICLRRNVQRRTLTQMTLLTYKHMPASKCAEDFNPGDAVNLSICLRRNVQRMTLTQMA